MVVPWSADEPLPGGIGRQCLALVESQSTAYLSTIDAEGYPQTRAVFNLRCRERFPGMAPLLRGHDLDLLLYFTTNTSSGKVAELQQRPQACAYICRAETSEGVTLTGNLEFVDDEPTKAACWHPWWVRYYPGGPADPEYAILRLRPIWLRGLIRGGPVKCALPLPD